MSLSSQSLALTDNLTRTTNRQNTQITQNNTTQNVALVNSTTDTIKISHNADSKATAQKFNNHA